jgi:hypothetical protein
MRQKRMVARRAWLLACLIGLFAALVSGTTANAASRVGSSPLRTSALIASPQALAAFAGRGRVTIAWNHNWERNLAYYKVYISLRREGPYSLHALVPADVSHYDFSGLNGVTYYFKVSAFGKPSEESAPSGPVAATPSATAALPLKVTTVGRQVRVNGAIFTAKGIKSTALDAPALASQGFNVVYTSLSPNVEAGSAVDAMNQAQRAGLKVILQVEADLYPAIYDASGGTPAWPVPKDVRLRRTLTGLNNVKDHPALLGYVMADEPEDQLHLEPDFDTFLFKARSQIKAVDPYHPLLVDVSQVSALDRFAPAADIVLLHHHVFVPTGAPLEQWNSYYAATIGETAGLAQSASARVPNKPFWASSFAYGNHTTPTYSTPRPPTSDEYTSIYYQWLAGGATGVLAYTFRQGSDWLLPSGELLPIDRQLYPNARRGSPELWQEMQVLNREHDTLRIVLALPTLASSPSASVPGSSIKTIVKQGTDLYVMAVNSTPVTAPQAPLTVGVSGNYAVRVLFENRTLRADNARWLDDFGPYARHVYRLTRIP